MCFHMDIGFRTSFVILHQWAALVQGTARPQISNVNFFCIKHVIKSNVCIE